MFNQCPINRRTLLAAAVAGGIQLPAWSQTGYPTRQVRIITPFPVASSPDVVARQVAQKLSVAWQQPVIVENRPGGNGFIAIDAFKRGAKDGTDLLILDNVHLAAYPSLFKKLPYDPATDFEIIAPILKAYFFFTVAAQSKYRTISDLIADAKANPGKLNYGSWSVGNPVHLGSELFARTTGIDMVHVAYKETTQLYAAVATGDLAFALGTVGTAGALYRAGRLRLLASASPTRNPAFPEVPTVAESGGPAGFEVIGWNAVVGPRGLPPAVYEKIRRDFEKALSEPDLLANFKSLGYESFTSSPEAFRSMVQTETRRFSDVIRQARISLD